MARDVDGLRIRKFAENAPAALKQTLEDAGIDRAAGLPASFSVDEFVQLPWWNAIWSEITALAVDLAIHGILEWSASQTPGYDRTAIVFGSNRRLYVATQAGGEAQNPVTDTSFAFWRPMLPAEFLEFASAQEVEAGSSTSELVTPRRLLEALFKASPNNRWRAAVDKFGLAIAASSADVAARRGSGYVRAQDLPRSVAIPNSSTTARGAIRTATQNEVNLAVASTPAITPETILIALRDSLIYSATTARRGTSERATQNEARAGSDGSRHMTPALTLDAIRNGANYRASRTRYGTVRLDALAGGGIGGPSDGKSANYTVVSSDDGKIIRVDANGANRTISLPNLSSTDNGYTVTVIKTDAGVHTITIDGNGADTINGAATAVLRVQYASVVLKWTGSLWLVIGEAGTLAPASAADIIARRGSGYVRADRLPALSAPVAAGGGIGGPSDGKSANYSVVSSDDGKIIRMDANGANRTVSLPNLSSTDNGYTVTVIKTDSGIHTITIDGNGSDTIIGSATVVLRRRYASVVLKWTGSLWLIIAEAGILAPASSSEVAGRRGSGYVRASDLPATPTVPIATTAARGISRRATATEADAGTATSPHMTPALVKRRIDAAGGVILATDPTGDTVALSDSMDKYRWIEFITGTDESDFSHGARVPRSKIVSPTGAGIFAIAVHPVLTTTPQTSVVSLFSVNTSNGALSAIGSPTSFSTVYQDAGLAQIGLRTIAWLITRNGGAQLFDVNASTGVFTAIGRASSVAGDVSGVGLTWNGTTLIGLVDGNNATRVYHINPSTGAATLQHSVAASGDVSALGLTWTGSLLLGLELRSTPRAARLLEISSSYNIMQQIGSTTTLDVLFAVGSGLLWDGRRLLAWIINARDSVAQLYTINSTTGVFTKIGTPRSIGSALPTVNRWTGSGLAAAQQGTIVLGPLLVSRVNAQSLRVTRNGAYVHQIIGHS